MDKHFREKLEENQNKAFLHIQDSYKRGINPICALSMGLGKTRVACNVIKEIINKSKCYKILIVIKTSNYKDPWIKELLKTECIRKNQNVFEKPNKDNFENCISMKGKERRINKEINSERYILPSNYIYIAPYDTLRIDIEENRYNLTDIFDLVIYDELHKITNIKKNTKNIVAIGKIMAHYKLGLTGTPIQNDILEIGLMYLFLNDKEKLSFYLSLTNQINYIVNEDEIEQEDFNDTFGIEQDDDKIFELLEEKIKVLNAGIDKCIDNKAIFLYKEKETEYKKNTFLLSLPINPKHYELAHTFYPGKDWKNLQKRIMYLSSPSSIYYYNYRNVDQPNCTKEKAVEIILKNMGRDEKAIIFSLYKDVLYSYTNLCEKWGLKTIILTGKEKGKLQDDSLNLFKTTNAFKVLLTTLQKSSEGFNFDYANHIIILELWWNPQKIIQAMSRIDRISQENKNIYIYLLCYNADVKFSKGKTIASNGIINEEEIFWQIMNKKTDDTNNFLKKVNEISKDNSSGYNELPKRVNFLNISNLEEEMSDFLKEFYVRPDPQDIPNQSMEGRPIYETYQLVQNLFNTNQNIKYLLKTQPWIYLFKTTRDYLKENFKCNLEDYGDILSKAIQKSFNSSEKLKFNYDSEYPFLFIKRVKFQILTGFYNKNEIVIIVVIGKRKNGQFHLFSPSELIFKEYDELFNHLYINNVKKISTIVMDSDIVINTQNILNNFHFNPRILLSFSSLVETELKVAQEIYDNDLLDKELKLFDTLFYQNSLDNGKYLLKSYMDRAIKQEKYLYRRIYSKLYRISSLYNYPNEVRPIIGTNIIIDLLIPAIEVLLENRYFPEVDIAKKYLTFLIQNLINFGDKFIPNWDILTMEI